jgi:hypothetical protein
MVAPLLPLAMMSMMPGMMPGMGLAMGAGAMAGGGLMGGLGKGIGNALGGGGGLFGGQKPKDIKFDKVTIKSLEIKDVSITNLSIGSTDKAEEGDKEEEDKGKIVDKTLTSDLEQEGSLTEKGFVGGMEDSVASPIEGLSDSNSELNEVLTGKSSIGGGFPELTSDTGSMDSGISEIADNTKILEEMFNWKDKEKEGQKGWLESIFDYILEGYDKLWGSITDIAKGAYTVVADFVNGLWDKMVESAQLAIEAFVAVSSEAREWVGQITESIQMVSGEMREWIVELAGVGIEIGEAIGEQVRKTFDTFVDQLNKTAANLSDIAVNIGTAVSEQLQGWVSLASTEVLKWTESIANIGIDIGKVVGDEVRATLTTVTDSLTDVVGSLSTAATDLASAAGTLMEGAGSLAEGAGKGIGGVLGGLLHGEGDTIIKMDDTRLYNQLTTQIQEITRGISVLDNILTELETTNSILESCICPGLALESENLTIMPTLDPGLALESENLTIVPGDQNTDELQTAIQENVAQEAISTERESNNALGKSGVISKTHLNQRPTDINIGQNVDKSRGMTPSYTKAPPKPRGHSSRTVNELTTYNQYPKWRTRMG